MHRKTIAALSAALLALPAAAQADPFTNGGFETLADGQPYPPNNSFNDYSANNVAGNPIAGWTITSGSLDYIGPTFWQPSEGSYSLDMNGSNAGTIAQTFDTIEGQAYVVSFDLSKNNNNTAGATLRVATDNTPYQDFTYTDLNSAADMMWSTQTYRFTATDTATTLSFSSQTDGNAGPALDNVRVDRDVAAVPEPAAWLLTIGGAGLAGAALRRRRSAVALA